MNGKEEGMKAATNSIFRLISPVVIVSLLIGMLGTSWPVVTRTASAAPLSSSFSSPYSIYLPLVLENFPPPPSVSSPHSIYLPLVLKNFPPPPSVFGVEINRGQVAATISQAADAGAYWVRYNGILWHEVEAVQGTFNWDALDGVASEIKMIRANGMEPMVVIRGTPTWAQKIPGYYCGPIKDEYLDEFASFVQQVVDRFKAAPYQVKYWEIGNEPDVHPEAVEPNSPYGCWGNLNDEYYGGGDYATMLRYVYPAIKQADPTAQVIFGGLLLVCDPAISPDDCKAAKFLEGALRNGGAPYFDILAYHSYPYWFQGPPNYEWDLHQWLWNHRRGVFLGKLDYLREILTSYNVQKPIMMNEGGMMCGWDGGSDYQRCLDGTLYNVQSNYVVRLYARAWSNNVIGAVWYTLNGPGWRAAGLLDNNQQPRPAYNAFKFLANLLREAEYAGQLSSGALEGYAFRNNRIHRTYQIYWSNDSAIPFNLQKPAGTLAVYNQLGENITPATDTIIISFDPITIIEISTP